MRIGLVGCGRWGRLILRDLVQIGVEVDVVCRCDESTSHARRGGARSVLRDVASLEGVDGIVVASTTATHAEVLERVLGHGVPVFCEKPLTADVASARRLVTRAGSRLFVMDKWRYHPVIEEMRRRIASGEVGDVLAVRTMRWQWGNPHTDVGALWILAPHDLAIGLHVLGRIPPVEHVFAVEPRRADLAFGALLRDGDGPSLTLDISIASPEHRRRCLVIGTRMTLELRDSFDDRVFARIGAPGSPDASESSFEVATTMPLLAELERFVAHVAGGPTPLSAAQDGLLVVERLAEIGRRLAALSTEGA